jgi:hypothetical protein
MVGASTWASGNQIWKGTIGIFVAKAIRKDNQTMTSLILEPCVPVRKK